MSIEYVDGHKNAISFQASSRSCERYLSNVRNEELLIKASFKKVNLNQMIF